MSDKPCWEITERWPKFCASLANGHGRCRKGTCRFLDSRTSNEKPIQLELSPDAPTNLGGTK